MPSSSICNITYGHNPAEAQLSNNTPLLVQQELPTCFATDVGLTGRSEVASSTQSPHEGKPSK